MPSRRTCLLSLFVLGIVSGPLGGDLRADADEKPAEKPTISYYRDIRPIFQVHCQGCHQPAKRGGGYVMTDFKALVAGGESEERAIVPGKPDESNLLALIEPKDGAAEMPKNAKPLSAEHRQRIRDWIVAGAPDDTPKSARPRYDMQNPPSYVAPPVLTSLEYSPDGKLLAISGYHEAVLHKTDGSGIAARLVGLSERIETVTFSPDGKRLAVAGGNPGRMGEIQVWRLADKKLTLGRTIGYDTLYGASWSHDGKLLAFGCPDNTVRAIEAETGKQVLFNGAHSDWPLDTVFSVKSDHLVTVSRDQAMKLINVPTQRFIDNITSITPGALKGGLNAVDRHPTKDQVLAGGADGVPKMYRMYREKARKIGDDFNLIRAFPKMAGRVFDVEFSRDGKWIIAGSSYNGKGEVRVFETDTGKERLKLEIAAGGVFAVAFHPNAKQAAVGGFDGYVRIIDLDKKTVIRKFPPVELQKTVAQAGGE